MLCMDGGGAKGVIEATILDKIFVTVASTLEYEVHLLNWLTIVIDRDVKEDKKKKKVGDLFKRFSLYCQMFWLLSNQI